MTELIFEEQVEILFSRPQKTITAEKYLREQRKVKRNNKIATYENNKGMYIF